MDFHQTWHRGAPLGVDELIRFWARSAKCQRSRVNELGLICYFYLVNAKSQEPLAVDFHQTWYRGAPPGVDELIRFWASSAQRQYAKGAPPRVDELIRFWA